MIAIDTDIAARFNASLAQAKLDALDILRGILADEAPSSAATHKRLAAAQILRTAFINLVTRKDALPAPRPETPGEQPASTTIVMTQTASGRPLELDSRDYVEADFHAFTDLMAQVAPEDQQRLETRFAHIRRFYASPSGRFMVHKEMFEAYHAAAVKPP